MANRVQTVIGLISREMPRLAESVANEREQARRDGVIIGLARVTVLSHSQRVAIFQEVTGKKMRPQHFPLELRKAQERK